VYFCSTAGLLLLLLLHLLVLAHGWRCASRLTYATTTTTTETGLAHNVHYHYQHLCSCHTSAAAAPTALNSIPILAAGLSYCHSHSLLLTARSWHETHQQCCW
jgi:hypothetical protein